MVSVGRAVLKKAVDRNRLKRRLRAAAAPAAAAGKRDITVSVKGRFEELGFTEIKRRVLSRLNEDSHRK